jgi:hypothetical protein
MFEGDDETGLKDVSKHIAGGGVLRDMFAGNSPALQRVDIPSSPGRDERTL